MFGLEVYVSRCQVSKRRENVNLIVGEQREKHICDSRIQGAPARLKRSGRMQKEVADSTREETHLTMSAKIDKLLMLLRLGLCLAMLMGEVQVEKLKRVKLKMKKNKRYAKSLFRIGLDALQNIIFNSKTEAKYKQLQLFINLLSGT